MSRTVNTRRINSRKVNRDRHRKAAKSVDLSGTSNEHQRVALRSNPHANTTLTQKKAKRMQRWSRFLSKMDT